MVLDEPAAGLDPRARVELRELIGLLATQMNKTVLISSHILTELGEICDSTAIIEAGRILASGTIDSIQQQLREGRGKGGSRTIVTRVLEDAERLEKWLLEQPYVSHVSRAGSIARFDFDGDGTSQVNLLKSMLDARFQVLEFQGKTESLEDAFMDITKGIMQ